MIAKHNPSEEQVVNLMILVENMVKSTNKRVKSQIYEDFGQFVYEWSLYKEASLGKQIDKLIVTYLEERETKDITDLDEISYFVAFNIPAIILVSSPKLWNFIKKHYFTLWFHEHFKVRRTLASSFFEVYKILSGCQVAKQYEPEMLDVFKSFWEDSDSSILDALISNIFSPIKGIENVKPSDSPYSNIMGKTMWDDVQNSVDKLNEILSKKSKNSITEVLKKAFRYAEDPLRVKRKFFIKNNYYDIVAPYWDLAIDQWQSIIESENYTIAKTAAFNFSRYISRVLKLKK